MAWTRSDAFVELRVRRSLAIGILVSLLIHLLVALVLSLLYRHAIELGKGKSGGSISVRLAPSRAATPSAPAPSEPQPQPPTEARSETQSKPVEKPRPPSRSRSVMTVLNNSSQSVATRSAPADAVPPPPSNTAPVDMMSMVNASRARRQQQDAEASRENAEAQAAASEPSADQIALANIHRNLENMARAGKGESGIFQIRSMGVRNAQFSFRGWTNDESNSTLQVIDVDAGPGGNVQLAVVRRMIQLIRTHYTGDFNFDSHRLGRVVVQSARLEDTAKLEAFLMQEFFGG